MSELRQRAPRERDPAYLAWIAGLPCIATLTWFGLVKMEVQVAHLRAASPKHGKPYTGKAEKPSDAWTTPLAMEWHTGDKRRAPFSQHEGNEEAFWARLGIDPFQLCLDLREAYMAGRPGTAVISRHAALGNQKRRNHGPL